MTPVSDYPELRHLHLLKAMGITAYQPRFRLPGAAASRVCNWPASAVVPSSAGQSLFAEPAPVEPGNAKPVQPTSVLQEEPQTGWRASDINGQVQRTAGEAKPEGLDAGLDNAVLANLPGEGGEAQLQPARHSVAASLLATQTGAGIVDKPADQTVISAFSGISKSETVAAVVEAPAFQALLCPVNHQVAILALLPALARPQLQEKETALLNNILRWLGMPVLAPLAPHVFRWPLPGVKLNGQGDAGRGLQAFLDQAAQEFGARQILVFGQLLQECLEAAGSNSHSLRFTATYSINELLTVPQLKREAWQALLPLHSQTRSGILS